MKMLRVSATKWVVFSICALFVIGLQVQQAEARPAPDQVAAMAEALKMLQQLDRHYAQIAKPRYGRSLNPRSYSGTIEGDSSVFPDASEEYRR